MLVPSFVLRPLSHFEVLSSFRVITQAHYKRHFQRHSCLAKFLMTLPLINEEDRPTRKVFQIFKN